MNKLLFRSRRFVPWGCLVVFAAIWALSHATTLMPPGFPRVAWGNEPPAPARDSKVNSTPAASVSTKVDSTPAPSPGKLQVPAGFVVELAAAPPLVQHPTMACLDDRGRMFVCENAGVNLSAAELEAQLPNSIRMLEDTNGDGIFDRATVFADRMTFPMGCCWLDGSLYVASPPHIWKLTDTTGDGVADVRIPLVGKFGYTGNAASIHGCFAGPDGRIYWCDGYHGHEFLAESGEIVSKRSGSYLFSCQTDGSDVRIHCGGGMDNPVEVDFTKAGDIIGTVNIMYTRPRVDCLVNWQYGGVYPHREKVLEELRVTGDFLGPIHRFGHVAISGTMRYRSGELHPEWQDNFFATFFNLGKVVRLELTPRGSSHEVVQREFISSTDRDFHPTDVLEDVDGSILVVDTGGWFYRGCPTSQMSKPDIQGGIYRVRRETGPDRGVANGNEIDFGGLSPDDLIPLLTDSRYRVRELALRECARRGSDMIAPLRAGQGGSAPQRLNITWALTRILGGLSQAGTGNAREAMDRARLGLIASLADTDASVRQAACQALLAYPALQACDSLRQCLEDASPAVRRVAAAALGRSGDVSSIPDLLRALNRTTDRDEEHALLYALLELNTPEATQLGLTDPAPAIRRGSLLVMDQMPESTLRAEQVARALQDPDEAVRSAALNILVRHKQDQAYLSEIVAVLEQRLPTSKLLLDQVQTAELLVLTSADERISRRIAGLLASPDDASGLSTQILRRLARESGLTLSAAWLPALEKRLTSADPEQLALVYPVLQAAKTHPFDPLLEQIATRETLPRILRIQLLMTRTGTRGKVGDDTFALLLEMLDRPLNSLESGQAAQALGNAPLNTAQLVTLAGYLPNANASSLRELIRPYQRSSSPEVGKVFFQTVGQARFFSTLPPQELSDIIIRYPQELRKQGNQLLHQLKLQEQQKLDQIDRLLPLLARGDAVHGKSLFFSEKAKCSTCHRVGSEGRQVGPDLSAIGANRAPRDLLESILFPSATIVRDYDAYTVVLIDGRVLTGLIARETTDAVELQQPSGMIERISREEIDEMSPSNVSLMPSGLEKEVSDREMADIIAYLTSLRQAATTTALNSAD